MSEKPIIFNGAMVRAILDGKKTQTRRPLKDRNFELSGQPLPDPRHPGQWISTDGPENYPWVQDEYGDPKPLASLFGEPGDLLWVPDPIGAIHQATIERNWDAICPRAFRAADDGRNPQSSQMIGAWRGENAWLAGASGIGKSWLGWQLLRRVAIRGKRVACIDSPLIHRYARSHGEDRADIEIAVRYARAVLVDDIDKMFEGKDLIALWDLIKLAADNAASMITTSNLTAWELRDWLQLDKDGNPLPSQSPTMAVISRTAIPLLRRIRENNKHGKTVVNEPRRKA